MPRIYRGELSNDERNLSGRMRQRVECKGRTVQEGVELLIRGVLQQRKYSNLSIQCFNVGDAGSW